MIFQVFVLVILSSQARAGKMIPFSIIIKTITSVLCMRFSMLPKSFRLRKVIFYPFLQIFGYFSYKLSQCVLNLGKLKMFLFSKLSKIDFFFFLVTNFVCVK